MFWLFCYKFYYFALSKMFLKQLKQRLFWRYKWNTEVIKNYSDIQIYWPFTAKMTISNQSDVQLTSNFYQVSQSYGGFQYKYLWGYCLKSLLMMSSNTSKRSKTPKKLESWMCVQYQFSGIHIGGHHLVFLHGIKIEIDDNCYKH